MFNIGKIYKVSNKYGRSSIARETMADEIGNVIARSIVWDRAEYLVKPQNEREIQMLRDAAFDNKELYIFDMADVELEMTWDGVDEWYDVVEGAMDMEDLLEEYRCALLMNADEYGDFADFLERAHGFDWDEERMIIEGGIVAKEIVA